MALQKDGISFQPFFQNRIAEIGDNLNKVEKLVETLEPILKVSGILNPADIAT